MDSGRRDSGPRDGAAPDGYGFLADVPDTPAARRLYDEDLAESGYVMNLTRIWAHQPEMLGHLTALLRDAAAAAGLSFRERGILVTATASTARDSYCSLAWGARLAGETGPVTVAELLRGSEDGLDARGRALARWARKVVAAPSGTSPSDVEELRAAGFTDDQVVAVTAFVAGRVAFSTVNAALGARPDAQLRDSVPEQVLAAVDYGRPVAP